MYDLVSVCVCDRVTSKLFRLDLLLDFSSSDLRLQSTFCVGSLIYHDWMFVRITEYGQFRSQELMSVPLLVIYGVPAGLGIIIVPREQLIQTGSFRVGCICSLLDIFGVFSFFDLVVYALDRYMIFIGIVIYLRSFTYLFQIDSKGQISGWVLLWVGMLEGRR